LILYFPYGYPPIYSHIYYGDLLRNCKRKRPIFLGAAKKISRSLSTRTRDLVHTLVNPVFYGVRQSLEQWCQMKEFFHDKPRKCVRVVLCTLQVVRVNITAQPDGPVPSEKKFFVRLYLPQVP
jgi:hypothetical protein